MNYIAGGLLTQTGISIKPEKTKQFDGKTHDWSKVGQTPLQPPQYHGNLQLNP